MQRRIIVELSSINNAIRMSQMAFLTQTVNIGLQSQKNKSVAHSNNVWDEADFAAVGIEK